MAIMACPECSGKLSDQADSCPHCGFRVAAKQAVPINTAAEPVAQKKSGGGWWKWLIGLPIACFLLLMVMALFSDAPTSHLVYEEAVKRMLKDPNSADFSAVKRYKNGYVCGQVNAKNSMGGYTGFRDFVVTPGAVALISDGSEITTKMIALQSSNCRN